MVRRRHPISSTVVLHPGYLAVAACIVEVELAVVVAATAIAVAVGFAGPVALVGSAEEN